MEENKEDIVKHLYLPLVETRNVPQKPPRKVCIAPNCVRYTKVNNITKTEYRCETTHFKTLFLNHTSSRHHSRTGTVQGETTICNIQEKIEKQISSTTILEQMVNKDEKIEAIGRHLRKLEDEEQQLADEQEKIKTVSVTFNIFLKTNAIAPYNDSLNEYVQYFINTHTENGGVDSKTIERLENLRQSYAEAVSVDITLVTCNIQSPQDIRELINDLYKLRFCGKMLKELAEAEEVEIQYKETVVHAKSKPNLKSRPNVLQNVFCVG